MSVMFMMSFDDGDTMMTVFFLMSIMTVISVMTVMTYLFLISVKSMKDDEGLMPIICMHL